jgi:hypothetical protein
MSMMSIGSYLTNLYHVLNYWGWAENKIKHSGMGAPPIRNKMKA